MAKDIMKDKMRKVLINAIPEMVQHILTHKDGLISDEAKSGSLDYGCGEKFRYRYTYHVLSDKVFFDVGYSFEVFAKESIILPRFEEKAKKREAR